MITNELTLMGSDSDTTPTVGAEELKDELRDRFSESNHTLENRKTGEPIPEAYQSECLSIVWVPEGTTDVIGIDLSLFVTAEKWEQGKGYYTKKVDDSAFADGARANTLTVDSDRQMVSMYAVKHGDVAHVICGPHVDTIAEILGIYQTDLLDTAMMRPNRELFPVLFDKHIEGGRLLITPIKDSFTDESPYSSI